MRFLRPRGLIPSPQEVPAEIRGTTGAWDYVIAQPQKHDSQNCTIFIRATTETLILCFFMICVMAAEA